MVGPGDDGAAGRAAPGEQVAHRPRRRLPGARKGKEGCLPDGVRRRRRTIIAEVRRSRCDRVVTRGEEARPCCPWRSSERGYVLADADLQLRPAASGVEWSRVSE